jgi:ADP-ribose pyrophosphatase
LKIIMNEKTIEVKTVFKGRLLTVEVLTVELESGVHSTRDIIRHRGAVAILARLPDGRFVLVEQFRKPIESEMLEVIAGCREAGEAPETSARREVEEETGYAVATLHPLGAMIPAPGYCDERLHLYFAELGAARRIAAPDDDERISVHLLTRVELDALIASDAIEDAKTIICWSRFIKSPWGKAGG